MLFDISDVKVEKVDVITGGVFEERGSRSITCQIRVVTMFASMGGVGHTLIHLSDALISYSQELSSCF